jgi:surfeit locus 1 family protein
MTTEVSQSPQKGTSLIDVEPSYIGQFGMVIRQTISRRWWKTTILVLLAMAVMARLGIWQLDRLEQRRAFNARVQAQLDQPTLILEGAALDQDLENMEYRQVIVQGVYDQASEVALRNQVWENQGGVHLLTPLKIANSDRAVLVNRGWIPYEDFISGDWSKYTETGEVQVAGVIRASESKPDFGGRTDPIPAPGESPLKAWHLANVVGISQQVPYELLPVYIQQSPDQSWTGMPYRTQPDLELTEGSHFGYAIQWFTFAGILGVGYLFFIRREVFSKAIAGHLKSSQFTQEDA